MGRIVNPRVCAGGGYAAARGRHLLGPAVADGLHKARRLLVATGVAVLAVVAVVMYARRVDTIEVAATLLFLPLFVAFVFRGVARWGGGRGCSPSASTPRCAPPPSTPSA